MSQPATIGPYLVLRTLGQGGAGTVYLGLHQALHRRDAIKVPHEHLRADLRRFQHEAQTVAGLKHSHITLVYDAA